MNKLSFSALFVVALVIAGSAPSEAKTAVDSGSRLIAQTKERGVVNNTWWKYDSLSIAYVSPHRKDYGQLNWFRSSYALNWKPNGKSDYYYNSGGKLDSIIGLTWDGNAYMNADRILTQTNASGLITDRIEQQWITAANDYVAFIHQTYSYNSSGALTDNIWQKWNPVTNAWYNIWRFNYTLNSQNKVTSDTRQYYDTALNSWVNSAKIDTTYAGNAISGTTNYNWNASNSSWLAVSRNVFTNNTAGKAQICIAESWDSASKAWQPMGRHSYTYDGAGNLSSDLYEIYPSGAAAYDTSYRDDYTYNALGQVMVHTGMPYQGGQWVLTTGAVRETFYYELYDPTAISTVTIPDLSFSVFPNPAANLLSYSLSGERAGSYKVAVSDMQGRILKSQHLAVASKLHTGKIDVGELPAGAYLFIVTDDVGSACSRQFSVVH
jgi:hypothetical protein